MKEKYPKIPICCAPRTCGLIILGLPFLPFLKIIEDSFAIAMMTKSYRILKQNQIEDEKNIYKKAYIYILYSHK